MVSELLNKTNKLEDCPYRSLFKYGVSKIKSKASNSPKMDYVGITPS